MMRTTRTIAAWGGRLGLVLGLGLGLGRPVAAAPSQIGDEDEGLGDEAAERAKAHLAAGELAEGDRAASAGCARDSNAREEGDPKRAEALWIEAECAAVGPAPLDALPLYRAIVERYPDAPQAPRSLAALADIHLAVARFADAAALMERFVALYPKEVESRDFLARALELRVALGQASEARRDVDRAHQIYGAKDPERAAAAEWSLRALAADDRQRREHAEAYLKRHGKRGGAHRQVVAEATLGAIEWRSACPVEETLGVCLAPPPAKRKKPAKVRRCGPPPRAPLARRAAPADAAQRRFAAIAKLASAGRVRLPDHERARQRELAGALAMSRIRALDREFEALLALAAPSDLVLTIDPALRERDLDAYRRRRRLVDESERRIHEFLAAINKGSARLSEDYMAVTVASGDPEARILGALRGAQLYERIAELLESLEVPRELAEGAQVKAFCDAVGDRATPYRERAREAYTYCVDRSTEYQHFTDASRACEAALARLDPRRYPALYEYTGEPSAGALGPWSEGVQFDPPPTPGPR